MTAVTLDALNALPHDDFARVLGDIFEHSPWVAAAAAASRPFTTITELHDAMMTAVRAAPAAQRLAFLRGHPELAGLQARAGALTADSEREQGGLGLQSLGKTDTDLFARLNAEYGSKFGFPFIICVRHHTRDAIVQRFQQRLANAPSVELDAALAEIASITRLRLVAKVDGPGKPNTEGKLSTHILNTSTGRPAPGVLVELHDLGPRGDGLIVSTQTNADGRTNAPLLSGGPLRIGTYQLLFHVGTYFRESGAAAADPSFLDIVPIRFSIAEPTGHYHVPLLASPWSYTTYRGS